MLRGDTKNVRRERRLRADRGLQVAELGRNPHADGGDGGDHAGDDQAGDDGVFNGFQTLLVLDEVLQRIHDRSPLIHVLATMTGGW